MAIRNIIQIDEAKCDGCGQCVTGCAEGALAIVDGKAKLVRESLCDGLGACIGECPQGALTIEQREADVFDDAAVEAHPAHSAPQHPGGGCPHAASRSFAPKSAETTPETGAAAPSQLAQWPIQLHLIQPTAPYFQDAEVLIAADCAAFACGDFHSRFLAGKTLIIACPKLDNPEGYIEKLRELFTEAKPRSVTVVRMEVPCCKGLLAMVLKAREQAGGATPVHEVVVGIEDGRTLMGQSH